jgi:hypothetical protein
MPGTLSDPHQSQPLRCYRLIDSSCEPHGQLDDLYSSIDEAIADAIAWVEPLVDRHHPAALIGVEVSTTSGDWRTCRLPAPLLCPLPRTDC